MVNESLQPARWGDPIGDDIIHAVEKLTEAPMPPGWRAYLQGPRWLREGWLESGELIQLFDPDEALGQLDAWGESKVLHPGIYLLGGDGSRNLYCVDLREAEPAVQLTDIASSGWHDVEPLLDSVEQFVDAIREGTFRAYPER